MEHGFAGAEGFESEQVNGVNGDPMAFEGILMETNSAQTKIKEGIMLEKVPVTKIANLGQIVGMVVNNDILEDEGADISCQMAPGECDGLIWGLAEDRKRQYRLDTAALFGLKWEEVYKELRERVSYKWLYNNNML